MSFGATKPQEPLKRARIELLEVVERKREIDKPVLNREKVQRELIDEMKELFLQMVNSEEIRSAIVELAGEVMKEAIVVNKKVEDVTHYNLIEKDLPVELPRPVFKDEEVVRPVFKEEEVKVPNFVRYDVEKPNFIKRDIDVPCEKVKWIPREIPFDVEKPNYVPRKVDDVKVRDRIKYVTKLICENCREEIK